MDKEKIIEAIKFHCNTSKKHLLKLALAEENLSQEAIKKIKNSFYYLKKNLIEELVNSTN